MKCNLDGCNKKINQINLLLKCKCEKSFCTIHRLPESHNCNFDHSIFNKDKFIKENKCVNKMIDY